MRQVMPGDTGDAHDQGRRQQRQVPDVTPAQRADQRGQLAGRAIHGPIIHLHEAVDGPAEQNRSRELRRQQDGRRFGLYRDQQEGRIAHGGDERRDQRAKADLAAGIGRHHHDRATAPRRHPEQRRDGNLPGLGALHRLPHVEAENTLGPVEDQQCQRDEGRDGGKGVEHLGACDGPQLSGRQRHSHKRHRNGDPPAPAWSVGFGGGRQCNIKGGHGRLGKVSLG